MGSKYKEIPHPAWLGLQGYGHNDESNLGVHDLNILFNSYVEGEALGKRELSTLVRFGFQHLSNENVPLWCWYSALMDFEYEPAVFSSLVGPSDDEKVGAISVLRVLVVELPTQDSVFNRDEIIGIWFSDESTAKLRTAALGYLAKCGNSDDYKVAKTEYDRSDRGTTRSALECMVEILLRTGQLKKAQKLLLESQFESLNNELLSSIVDGFENLKTSTLTLGLEHSNSQVRLHATKALRVRGALTVELAEQLTGDANALVRHEAVLALSELGKTLHEKVVKDILLTPQNRTDLLGQALSGMPSTDTVGEELFQRYQIDVLKRLSESELEEKVESNFLLENDAYFALSEKYFKRHVKELRRNVDDRFGEYYDERIRLTNAWLGDSSKNEDVVKSARGVGEFIRKKLTRKGLDILSAAKKPEDLQRIRTNLMDGYTGASLLDIKFLQKHGDWSDIPMLATLTDSKHSLSPLTIPYDTQFRIEVAKTISSIGRKYPISDLVSLPLPAFVLRDVLEICSEARFAEISQAALLALFDHDSDGVRRAAAIMAVRTLTSKRIKATLREYMSSDKTQYYNVIHWLDLGASMRRDLAKKIAREASG